MVAGRYLAALRRGLVGHGRTLGLALVVFGATAQIGSAAEPARKAGVDTQPPAPFAVVELFTSESCPTCPAADRLLSEIGTEARKRGRRIMPLAFHVDYWKTGSAADPLSTTAYARRQKTYAAALGTEDVYTPQMIVNGRAEFVGSERATARQQIESALARPATASVKLELVKAAKPTPDTLTVRFEAMGAITGANVQIAVVERGLTVRTRSGRTLAHDNVVRAFASAPLSKGSLQTVELPIPASLVRRNASVVAFVQNSRTQAILGATSIDLEPAPAAEVAQLDN